MNLDKLKPQVEMNLRVWGDGKEQEEEQKQDEALGTLFIER